MITGLKPTLIILDDPVQDIVEPSDCMERIRAMLDSAQAELRRVTGTKKMLDDFENKHHI